MTRAERIVLKKWWLIFAQFITLWVIASIIAYGLMKVPGAVHHWLFEMSENHDHAVSANIELATRI